MCRHWKNCTGVQEYSLTLSWWIVSARVSNCSVYKIAIVRYCLRSVASLYYVPALQMQDFLLNLHDACHQWRLLHLNSVPAIECDDWVARSFEILAAGYAAQPPPPASSPGARKGRPKQSKAIPCSLL